MENQRLKADLDNVTRQRRHLSERISKWEHELNRDDISSLGEEGLRQELRIAIKTLQIRDHKYDSSNSYYLSISYFKICLGVRR